MQEPDMQDPDMQNMVAFGRIPVPIMLLDLSGVVPLVRSNDVEAVSQLVVALEASAAALDAVTAGVSVVGANQRAIDLLEGVAEEELVGGPRSGSMLRDEGVLRDLVVHLSNETSVWSTEASGLSLRGRPLEVRLHWSTFRDGILFRSLVHIEDVRKERRLKERIHQLTGATEVFLAAVSHQLRTPLTAVVGFTQHALDVGTDSLAVEESLRVIAEQADELTNVVEDLLVASRQDIGTLAFHRKPVDLGGAAMNVLRTLYPDTPIETTIEPSLVWGDAARVRQIIRHLMVNAVQHGGRRISLETGTTGSKGVLVVSDDGLGIPAAHREEIFEVGVSFATGLTPGALGIGLAVARRLAESMGGEMVYEYDGRSRFKLSLPSVSGSTVSGTAQSRSDKGESL